MISSFYGVYSSVCVHCVCVCVCAYMLVMGMEVDVNPKSLNVKLQLWCCKRLRASELL